MNRKSLPLCFGPLLLASALSCAQAQVVADAACPTYAVDIAAFATCDGDRVARAASRSISPSLAAVAKAEHGRGVLLLDVRSHTEAAFGGHLAQADALVPFAEVAQPLRWDPATGALALDLAPDFVALAQAWIATLGGDRDTPLLLVCRTGAVAEQAAAVLRASGYRYVTVVQGGMDGAQSDDGPQYAGWKAAGLPWLTQADPVFLFGTSD